jgi:far upstream element-binding protein
MNKGHDIQSDGHITTEMMIPGNKAGIVIGKGGETIKQLQV